MSRSYKHSPYYTDGGTPGTKISKRFANKKVRNYKKQIPKGNFYKKIFCSYDIHDYVIRWSWSQARFDWEHKGVYIDWKKDYPTLKDFYKYWSKNHRRK